MKVNILGTDYSIVEQFKAEDEGGLTNYVEKTITINTNACDVLKERVIRHEIVHAFLYESGLTLAYDETIVDWIAIQLPKINKALQEVENGNC